MRNEEYNLYLNNVKEGFKKVKINKKLQSDIFYTEKFKVKWFFLKLKIFSHFKYEQSINQITIENFSKQCTKYSLKKYSGLPRGFSSGIVSYNILVGNNITKRAIKFVNSYYENHFAAFEIPIIIDLPKEKIYYCTNLRDWAGVHSEFLEEFILNKFDLFQ